MQARVWANTSSTNAAFWLGRRRTAALTLACLLTLGFLAASAAARRGEPVLVSQAGGVAANDTSLLASLSADGRFVAFESGADNLSIGDNNTFQNVFVRDLQTNTTTLVSQAGGVSADDHSGAASISADGRFVAFESDADNLSTGDNNSFRNIFVRDLQAGTTTLASITSDNNAGANNHSFRASISADGRFVAFESDADNLVTGDNNNFTNVFVRDVQLNTTTLVSQAGGVGADDHSGGPSISADGRFVAFESDAANLSTGDNNSFSNVFVRDLQANTTTLASVTDDESAGGNDNSEEPSLSASGRFVAFESHADNLSTGDNNSFQNVFARDLQANTTTLVSQAAGVGADGSSDEPSISADGRFVAFESSATNLSTVDSDGFIDIFVRELQAGTTTLVSHAGGVGGDDHSSDPSISADGRFVAFSSDADNLSPLDNDAFENVFRQDLIGLPPSCSDVAQTVTRDTSATVSLTCSDEDGDPLTRTIATGPAHGSLGAVDQAAGSVVYTPDPGYVGPDSFSFAAADQSGGSNAATASLTVTAPAVAVPAFGADTLVTLSLARKRIPAKGPVPVWVANGNDFTVTGRLGGRTVKRVAVSARRKRVRLRAKAFQVGASARKTVKLRLPKPLRRLLRSKRKLALRLTATVEDPAGNSRTVSKRLAPKLKRRRARSR